MEQNNKDISAGVLINTESAGKLLANALQRSNAVQASEGSPESTWKGEEYKPDEALDMLEKTAKFLMADDAFEYGRTQAFYISPRSNRSYQDFLTDCVTAVRKAANEEYGGDEYKNRMLAVMPDIMGILAQLKDRESFQERRLEHALKVLKKKKLHSADLSDLEDLSEGPALRTLMVAHCCIGKNILNISDTGSLDDGSWKIGIDMAMTIMEPDLGMSDSLYGPKLTDHLPLIYACTVMSAYGSKFARLTGSKEFMEAISEPILNMALKSEAGQMKLHEISERAAKRILQEKETAWKREKNTISTDLASLESENKQLKKELDMFRGKDLSKNLKESQELYAAAQSEIQALLADVNVLRDSLEERDRKLSELSDKLENGSMENVTLPDDAMFFGGHPNMLKKVMLEHPSWTFIDGTDENFNVPVKAPSVLFIWDKHISHPTWWRIRSAMYGRTPVVYVKSTNTDIMELEMKKGWLAASGKESPETNGTEN